MAALADGGETGQDRSGRIGRTALMFKENEGPAGPAASGAAFPEADDSANQER